MEYHQFHLIVSGNNFRSACLTGCRLHEQKVRAGDGLSMSDQHVAVEDAWSESVCETATALSLLAVFY